MQEIQGRSLVQEDPTGCRATKSVYHNYRACALQQREDCKQPLLVTARDNPVQQQRPGTAPNKTKQQPNKIQYSSRPNSQQTKNKLNFFSRIKSISEKSSANIKHYGSENSFPFEIRNETTVSSITTLERSERKAMKGERKKRTCPCLQMMWLSMGKV